MFQCGVSEGRHITSQVATQHSGTAMQRATQGRELDPEIRQPLGVLDSVDIPLSPLGALCVGGVVFGRARAIRWADPFWGSAGGARGVYPSRGFCIADIAMDG